MQRVTRLCVNSSVISPAVENETLYTSAGLDQHGLERLSNKNSLLVEKRSWFTKTATIATFILIEIK